MQELLRNPRVRTLLRQAEDAQRLLETLGPNTAAARDVHATLQGIFRDLGQNVHGHWRALLEGGVAAAETAETEEIQDLPLPSLEVPVAEDRSERDGEHTEIPEMTEGGPEGEDGRSQWYTDEVEWDGQGKPLFEPGEIEPGANDLDEITPRPEGAEPHRPRASVHEAEPLRIDPAHGPIAELLSLLDAPADPLTEASRAQWAATQLDRVVDFPPALQVAVMAVVACRARHVMESTDQRVAGRSALDRVRRWHRTTRLPEIPALLPHAHAETVSWLEDARAWRATLTQP
jgi:hypothetical protein